MTLTWVDYLIIGLYFVVTISIGFWLRRQAGKSLDSTRIPVKHVWLGMARCGGRFLEQH